MRASTDASRLMEACSTEYLIFRYLKSRYSLEGYSQVARTHAQNDLSTRAHSPFAFAAEAQEGSRLDASPMLKSVEPPTVVHE